MEEDADNQKMTNRGKAKDQQKGIDVSNWQGKIDWDRVSKTGVKHVCIKMTEGGTYMDPSFEENWKNAEKARMSVNCYHYFRGLSATPEEQMENIRNTARGVNFDPEKNILAVDVEKIGNENATPLQMATNLKTLLNLIKKDKVLSRSVVMIYTSHSYWDTKVLWDKYDFSVYPLWVAHWEVQKPCLPQPWRFAEKTWIWWQHSAKGNVDGITGEVDLDWVKTHED